MRDRTNDPTRNTEIAPPVPPEDPRGEADWEVLESELFMSDREASAGFGAMLPVWPPALRVRRGQPFT